MRQITFQQVPADEDVLPALLDAIGEYEGVDPAELNPELHHHVDTDALQSLFAPMADGTRRAGQVSFPLRDALVVIDFGVNNGDTWIRVLQRPESPSSGIATSVFSE